MKAKTDAWLGLYDHAESMLRPGFAERTLRAARAVAPTFFSQCLLSAATAAICLVLILLVHSRVTAHQTAQNLAGWQEIQREVDQLAQLR